MKKIENARSYSNGIIFYSNTRQEYATDAYLDKNGEPQTRPLPTVLENSLGYNNLPSTSPALKLWMLIVFDGLLIISSILLAVFYGYFSAILATTYFSIAVSYKLFNLTIISIYSKYRDKANHSIAKFHGAEHMATNAYNKLQRVPTLEEIKKFSRFSKDCGSMQPIIGTVMLVLLSINLLIPSIVCILTLLFILLFMNIACMTGFLRFLQVFFVSKPTDTELLLAIKGLKDFEEMEGIFEKIKKSEDQVLNDSKKCFTNVK